MVPNELFVVAIVDDGTMDDDTIMLDDIVLDVVILALTAVLLEIGTVYYKINSHHKISIHAYISYYICIVILLAMQNLLNGDSVMLHNKERTRS